MYSILIYVKKSKIFRNAFKLIQSSAARLFGENIFIPISRRPLAWVQDNIYLYFIGRYFVKNEAAIYRFASDLYELWK